MYGIDVSGVLTDATMIMPSVVRARIVVRRYDGRTETDGYVRCKDDWPVNLANSLCLRCATAKAMAARGASALN